jgi:hypothetical protein
VNRRIAITATAIAAAAAAVSSAAIAASDPVVPQPGTACVSDFVGATTLPPDAKAPLVCAEQAGAGAQWQPVATPYPVSDRWLTFGPEVKLHGEGLRNATIRSGDWTAMPLDPGSSCRAEQYAVIPGTPTVGPPRIDQSATGKPLSFEVVPKLFSIQMSGYCSWTRVNS